MQSWVSSFVKNCSFKHRRRARDQLADVGCKRFALRFATDCVCCPWSSNFCTIQWSNWTIFQESVIWNGHCVNRTAASYSVVQW